MPKAIIFGGSGQIGSVIAQKLQEQGWAVSIPTRRSDDAAQRFSLAKEILDNQMAGCDAVINCIGILAPNGKDSFTAIHRDLPARLAAHAVKHQIKHFVQISALGADAQSLSAYARSKAEGEAAVKMVFPDAVIFRPSIVFGARDSFFNRFAAMARFSPFLPLIGGGHSRFQPVYVNDVADAVIAALTKPEAKGKIFELGGPRTYSFKELMEFILRITGMKRVLLPLPWMVATMQAAVFEHLPGKILTRDQLKLLRKDNVVAGTLPGFEWFGIKPASIEAIVPTYLAPKGRG